MPRALIVTVGTGRDREDIAGAIFFSIRRQRPTFIVFILSKQSEEETFSLIKDGLDIDYEAVLVEEIDDVETLFLEYRQIVRRLLARGYAQEDVIADYTSGTKAMSAALFSAAISAGIGQVSYTHGQRDRTGRVIPGKERLKVFSPVRIFAERDLTRARQFYNLHRFESCADVCGMLIKTAPDRQTSDEANYLITLSMAYDHWDRFKQSDALKELKKLERNCFVERDKIASALRKNLAFLEAEHDKKYSYEKVIDLVENARRRFSEEGRIDDGLARLYRAFEYLSQVRLYSEHGIETEDLDLKKLPENLRAYYARKRNERGKIQLTLVAGYGLLRDFGDETGRSFMQKFENDGEFKKALAARNRSILAHGFRPIRFSDAEALLRYFEDFARHCYPKWDRKRAGAQFPKLGER